MSFRGVTFNKQTCKSEDDALIFHTFLNAAVGRVRGCAVTYDAESIYIAPGYFMTYGRLVNVVGTETLTPEAIATGTQYNRLVFTIDLSLENTASVFNQGYFEFLSSYDGYPSLTQEDLFDGGYVYQIPICRFELTVDGIGNYAEEMGEVNISNVWTTLEENLADYREQFEEYYKNYQADFVEWFNAEQQIILQMIEDLQGQDFMTNSAYKSEKDALADQLYSGIVDAKLLTSDGEEIQDKEYNTLYGVKYIQFK